MNLPDEHQLRSFFLWSKLPDAAWNTLSARFLWVETPSGGTVFPSCESENCLCVLWEGQARVFARSRTPDHAALLRTMESGALFGVQSVFSTGLPPQSHIIAAKKCLTLLVPADAWENALANDAATMATYVRFLTERIGFLNQKIRYLTAGGAEKRLALYLLSIIPDDDVPVRLPLSAVALADLLALGRASLYRAMDQLTADGFLTRDGRSFCLHRRAELPAYYS